VPTADEWAEVYASGISLGYWTTNNGIQFGNKLLLPMGGYRNYGDAILAGVGG
jgi:hypothetical protein